MQDYKSLCAVVTSCATLVGPRSTGLVEYWGFAPVAGDKQCIWTLQILNTKQSQLSIASLGDTVVLLVGHRTCDFQVAGLSPGWAPLRTGIWQATYTCAV